MGVCRDVTCRLQKKADNNSIRGSGLRSDLPKYLSHSRGRLSYSRKAVRGQKNEDASLRIVGNKRSLFPCCLFLILQYPLALTLAVQWDGTFPTMATWAGTRMAFQPLYSVSLSTFLQKSSSHIHAKQVLNKVYFKVMRTEKKNQNILVSFRFMCEKVMVKKNGLYD